MQPQTCSLSWALRSRLFDVPAHLMAARLSTGVYEYTQRQSNGILTKLDCKSYVQYFSRTRSNTICVACIGAAKRRLARLVATLPLHHHNHQILSATAASLWWRCGPGHGNRRTTQVGGWITDDVIQPISNLWWCSCEAKKKRQNHPYECTV